MHHLLPYVQPEDSLRDLAELAGFRILHRERLDDAIPSYCLIKSIRHLCHFFLVGFAQQPQPCAKPECRIKNDRQKNERHGRQLPINDEDGSNQKDQDRGLFEKFRKRFGSRRLDPLYIGRHTRDELASRIEMEKSQWLIKDLRERVVAKIPHHSVS